MTRSQLIEDVARRTGTTLAEARRVVDLMVQSMGEALVDGRRIELRGLGTFQVKEYRPRRARNPRTGDGVDLPARVRPAFRMGKEIRERLNPEVDA